MYAEHISPGPERWQNDSDKQTTLPNIKELSSQRERWGKFMDYQNTKQKGGRVVRGMRKGERKPLARWVKKGSVSIKLGLKGFRTMQTRSEALNQSHHQIPCASKVLGTQETNFGLHRAYIQVTVGTVTIQSMSKSRLDKLVRIWNCAAPVENRMEVPQNIKHGFNI